MDDSQIEKLYKKIAEVDEQIKIRREALAKAQSSNNNNPFYSEATRVGHLAKLEQQAQTDIGNFLKEKETYILLLHEIKADTSKSLTSDLQNDTTNKTEVVYEISFTKTREILLNNAFLLAKPDFDRENESVFNFLYAKPNRKHSLEEIEKNIGKKVTKSLHKIVENLGFTGDIKKVFIDVTKSSICFRNPITRSELEKLGINKIRLQH